MGKTRLTVKTVLPDRTHRSTDSGSTSEKTAMSWLSYSSLIPPNLFILLTGIGLVLAWRWTRLGLVVATRCVKGDSPGRKKCRRNQVSQRRLELLCRFLAEHTESIGGAARRWMAETSTDPPRLTELARLSPPPRGWAPAGVRARLGTYGGLIRLLLAQIEGGAGSYHRFKQIHWGRVRRVVFGCHGNICRCPYAERRAATYGLLTASFGLCARTGAAADPSASRIAARRRIELANHYACNASDFNEERPHQSLGYRTPRQIYEEGLWICGRSALPTGSASPASRASSEGGKILAFAHIPAGTTANRGFDRDEVITNISKPASALATSGADIEIGRATPLRRGSGCLTIGVDLTPPSPPPPIQALTRCRASSLSCHHVRRRDEAPPV